jgi:hypothetical protein
LRSRGPTTTLPVLIWMTVSTATTVDASNRRIGGSQVPKCHRLTVVGAVVYLTQLFYASDTARGLGGGIFPMASYKIIRRIAAIRVDAIHHPAKWRIPPLVVSLRDCAALLSDLTPGVWADGQAGPSHVASFGFRDFRIIGHGNPAVSSLPSLYQRSCQFIPSPLGPLPPFPPSTTAWAVIGDTSPRPCPRLATTARPKLTWPCGGRHLLGCPRRARAPRCRLGAL